MGKSIGQVIRGLRRRDNIVQEKLAEALNVSFQSVSRWENDLAAPDISLIPVIAKYFNVTTDVLFDMNNKEHQQNKEAYEETFRELRKNGELCKCKELMLEARREYPRDFHIMMNLAEILDLYEGGTGQQREEYAVGNFSGQIYSLCQSVLEDCRDESERCRAVRLLCEYYVESGNTAEALHLAKSVADTEHSRERLLEQIYSGDQKLHQLQSNMLAAIDYTATALVKIAFQKEYGFAQSLSVDDKIEYVKAANQLYNLLMPDGNFQFYHRVVGWNWRRLAELYLLKNDTDKAFEYLLMAEKEATKYDELREHKYTSPFVSTLEYVPEEYFKCWTGSERGMLLYRVKELMHYFSGHTGVKLLMERLLEVTKGESDIRIE